MNTAPDLFKSDCQTFETTLAKEALMSTFHVSVKTNQQVAAMND